MTAGQAPKVRSILRFGLTSRDAAALAAFYEAALGCRRLRSDRRDASRIEAELHVRGGAERIMLGLGRQVIELLAFDQPGRAYPDDLSPFDACFQHFAIVVSNMGLALQKLATAPGWSPISRGGPQHLPQSSGGVTAFKFRDPEGHPLEFLEFAAGRVPAPWRHAPGTDLFLGIDHSAISVADAGKSISFYAGMGLAVVSRTQNHGIEQQQLDGIADPRVDVIALAPPLAAPHLELLCYHTETARRRWDLQSNDLPATRLVLESGSSGSAGPASMTESDSAAGVLLKDPDGHRLLLV